MSGVARGSDSPASDNRSGASNASNAGSARLDSPVWYDMDQGEGDVGEDEDPDYRDEPDDDEEDEDFFDVLEGDDDEEDEGKPIFSLFDW